MNAKRTGLKLVAVLAVAIAGLSITGCMNRGDDGDRLDPYETTASDKESNRVSMPALLEFSDITAAKLSKDLASIDKVQQSPGRVVLEMGEINNRTGTPTNDYELIQRRLRSQLVNSPVIRDKFIIVENIYRGDRELARVTGEQPTTTGTTQRYDKEDIYLLVGDFYQANRRDTRRYFFEFTLTHLASRETLLSKSYDLSQE